MEVSIKNVNAAAPQSDCLVVGVYEAKVLSEAAQEIDRASKGGHSAVDSYQYAYGDWVK